MALLTSRPMRYVIRAPNPTALRTGGPAHDRRTHTLRCLLGAALSHVTADAPPKDSREPLLQKACSQAPSGLWTSQQHPIHPSNLPLSSWAYSNSCFPLKFTLQTRGQISRVKGKWLSLFFLLSWLFSKIFYYQNGMG